MDLQLSGKMAVVTGSTAGIGKAIAAELAREGATVVVNGRKRETVDHTIRDLAAAGKVYGVPADLSTDDGVHHLIEEADKLAPVEILVNNFGVFEPKPFEQISDEDWMWMFTANVMSGVRASRTVMSGMRERGWGRILFISSESGINTPAEMVHYGMTKSAQLAVARGLARDLAGTGVTVNSVLPGPTWTEGVETFVEKMAGAEGVSKDQMKREFVSQNRPTSLLQRFASPEEVAGFVAYLASPRAAAVTGSAHRVEGGIVNTCF